MSGLGKTTIILISSSLLIARAGLPASAHTDTDSATDSIRQQRQNFTQKQRLRSQNLHDAVQNRRNALRQQTKDRLAALRQKLTQLKDQRKAAIVERINTKLARVNEKATNRMTTVIEKLDSILARIDNKTQSASAQGKDVSTAQGMVASANNALADAKSAVSSQAGKDYTIQISSEDSLRSDVGATFSQLQQDLRSTRKTVIQAKQAVMQAARALKLIMN